MGCKASQPVVKKIETIAEDDWQTLETQLKQRAIELTKMIMQQKLSNVNINKSIDMSQLIQQGKADLENVKNKITNLESTVIKKVQPVIQAVENETQAPSTV